MKLSVATVLLAASCAVAAPGTANRKARAAERRARRDAGLGRNSNIAWAVNSTEPLNTQGDVSHPEYSSNWAGAVLIGTGYTSVTGIITVPTPSTPSGGSSRTEYYASAWVGIDGDTCGTAILQTGIDFAVQGSEIGFDAWYEWYPDYAYDFSGISISAGDEIQMTVTATSTTAGTAVIDNLSNGQSVTHTFNGGVDGDLCEYNAEWIVEDFSSGNSMVPFADFGTVTFTSASAVQSGTTVGVTGATIIDIEQNGEVLTDCSTSGSSTVTCTYTG